MLKSKLYNTSTKCVVGVWENKNPTKFLFKIAYPDGVVEYAVATLYDVRGVKDLNIKISLVRHKGMLKAVGLN